MDACWIFLHRARFASAFLVFLITAFSFPYASKLSIDPSNSSIFSHNQALRDQAKFEQAFGAGENIVVGLETPGVLSLAGMKWIEDLTLFFESIPEIHSVRSLARVKGLKRKLFSLDSSPISREFLSGRITQTEFRDRLFKVREVSSPLFSADGGFGLTAAELTGNLSGGKRHEVIEKTRAWIQGHPPVSGKAWLSGSAVEQDTFVSFIQRDNKRIVPLTIAVMVLTMILTQLSLTAFIYPLTVLAVTFILTQALMVLTGHAMNVVTNLVLPVILIVSVSDPIHYSSFHIGPESEKENGLYLKRMFKALGLPCFMTSATTAAGFLSLVSISVPAIRMFGLYAAAGTAIAYFAAVLLAPFFISVKTPSPRGRENGHHPFATFWILLIRKIRFALPLFSLILLFVGFQGVFRVRAETDILSSFSEEEPFRQATLKIQEKTGGVYTLEALIRAPDDRAYFKRENLEKILALKKEISAIEGVMMVRDVTDLISMIDRAAAGKNKERGVLPSDFYLKRYLEGIDRDTAPELKSVKTPYFRDTRMTAELSFSSADKTFEAAEKMRLAAQRLLPPGWEFIIAGKTYLLAEMSRGLVRNQVKSIVISFGAIAIMMILSLRSIRFGLLSAYVNLLPLALLGFVMARFQIPLSTATATVAGVAAGLIIDNAIHVLFSYRDCAREGVRHPVEVMLSRCAVPLTISTLTLCAGFSVTLFGSVKPTIYFGQLMITVLGIALAANLLFLPAFLNDEIKGIKHV